MTKYTTILHEPRIEHGLTLMEYVFLDSVYKLQSNPKSQVPGWCYATRDYLAEFLGVSKQTILNLIETTTQKGFLVKNEATKFIQTLPLWYDNFVDYDESKNRPAVKKLDCGGKETLPTDGKETLPATYNNSNSDNKRDNSTPNGGLRQRFVKPTIDEIRDRIAEMGYTFQAEAFYNYYEANGWRVGRNPMKDWRAALANWQRNDRQYNKGSTGNGQLDDMVAKNKISPHAAQTMAACQRIFGGGGGE